MNVKCKSLLIASCLMVVGMMQATAQNLQDALKALDADRFGTAQTLFKQLASTNSADNQFYQGYYYLRIANLDSAKRSSMIDSAKIAFNKGLSLDPKNALDMVGQGGVALATGNLSEGKAKINQALELSKSRDENVLWRSAEMYTLFERGGKTDPAEAIRLIDLISALKKKTERPDYQLIKGDAYLIRNEGGPAVSAYEEALRLNTDPSQVARIQTRIGRVFKRGKNYTETQKSFLAAISADSTYAPVYREFGELWLMAGDYRRAATNYKKYLDNTQGTPEDKLRYAKFAFLSRDYPNAIAQLDQIKGRLKDTDIDRMYGYSYVETEKPQPAVESLEQLLKSLPENKKLSTDYGYLGRAYSMLDGDSLTNAKYDSLAYFYLGKAAPIDTSNNYYQYIGDTKYKGKDYIGAAKSFQDMIDWKSKKGAASAKPNANDYIKLANSYYYGYGLAPKEKRDSTLLPKADSAYLKINQMAPDYLTAYFNNTLINQFADPTGVKNLAVPAIQRYIDAATRLDTAKNKPGIIAAYKRLALYAQIQKDKEKATQYFTKVKELDPADKDAELFLNPPPPPAPVAKPKATPAKKPAAKPAAKK